MFDLWTDFASTMIALSAGIGLGIWINRLMFQRRIAPPTQSEANWMNDVIHRLENVAATMTADVGRHSTEVRQINDELTSTTAHDAAVIVKSVARLVAANDLMQRKLADSEDQLVEQAQQIGQHSVEARTDPLTGLANRRALDEELSRRLAEFVRHGRRFSLAIIDIDHFKKYNDEYGRDAGDDVLRRMADLMRDSAREMDLVARYGGEELVLVLPGASLADARKLTERLRQLAAVAKFDVGSQHRSVTISAGVARVMPGDDADSLFQRADLAVYASKNAGRNRMAWHDGDQIHVTESTPKADVVAPPSSVEVECPQPEPDGPEQVEEVAEEEDVVAEPAVACERSDFQKRVCDHLKDFEHGGLAFAMGFLQIDILGPDGAEADVEDEEELMREVCQLVVTAAADAGPVGLWRPNCYSILFASNDRINARDKAIALRDELQSIKISADGDQLRLATNLGATVVVEGDDWDQLVRRTERALDAACDRGGAVCFEQGARSNAPVGN